MSLSVLGCVVNGPGEARETDIGITGGGNGKHMVYLSGVTDHHVEDADMIAHIVALVEAKAAEIEAGSAVSMDRLHGQAASGHSQHFQHGGASSPVMAGGTCAQPASSPTPNR